MEDKIYNVKPKKKECSMPIQLQLVSDEDLDRQLMVKFLILNIPI